MLLAIHSPKRDGKTDGVIVFIAKSNGWIKSEQAHTWPLDAIPRARMQQRHPWNNNHVGSIDLQRLLHSFNVAFFHPTAGNEKFTCFLDSVHRIGHMHAQTQGFGGK